MKASSAVDPTPNRPTVRVWGSCVSNERTAATFAEVEVLKHGVELGRETWKAFIEELGWSEGVDRTICHQVGSSHREAILRMIDLPEEHDFVAYDYLGNTGTVALPLAAALAAEREFLESGHRVGFLGIGSGLNCTMLGVEW